MATGGLIIPPGQYRPPGRDAPLFPAVKQAQRVRRHLQQIAREAAELDPAAMQLLLPVLQDARKELIRDLKAWLQNVPDGNLRFTAQRYREALVAVEGTMAEMARLQPAMNAALTYGREVGGALAVGHTIFEMSRMASVFDGEFNIPQIDTALVLKAGRKQLVKRHRTSAARYSGRVIQDLQHQFGVGLARGETFHELTERMRRLGGPRGLVALKGVIGEPGAQVEEIAEGLFRRHRHWAERIVRTETMNAYNVQHSEAIDQINADREEDEPELLKRWDASIDKRLCQICADLDRRAVPTDKEFTSGVMHPPAHPNCRCVVTAWDARWGNIKGEKKAITEGKKAKPPAPVTATPPAAAKPAIRKRPAKPAAPPTAAPIVSGESRLERRVVGGVADGKWLGARRSLEQDLTAQGFSRRIEATDQIRLGNAGTARGYHDSRGKIVIDRDAGRQAREFAQAWRSNSEGVRAAMAEARELSPTVGRLGRKADALYPQISKARARLDALRPGGPPNPLDLLLGKEKQGTGSEWEKAKAKVERLEAKERTLQERRKAVKARIEPGARYLSGADKLRTLYHETLHGYGPGQPTTWREVGLVTEEISTEVLARRRIMSRFGVPAEFYAKGHSYGEWVDPFTDKISEVYGVEQTAARSMLEDASRSYKSSATRERYAYKVADLFVEQFPGTKGQRDRLRSKLNALATSRP